MTNALLPFSILLIVKRFYLRFRTRERSLMLSLEDLRERITSRK